MSLLQRIPPHMWLLVTAIIWGFTFVAQIKGMDGLGPFWFMTARFFLGVVSLVPLLLWSRRAAGQALNPQPSNPANLRRLIYGSVITGGFLFVAASLQQVGLLYTSAGKAGFITSLYILFVPIIGYFFGHRLGAYSIAGALLATFGLYLLSIKGDFRLARGDLLQLIGAVAWAGHVLCIAWLSPKLRPLDLAIGQYLVCAFACLLTALCFEQFDLHAIWGAALPILYAGIFATGIALTLQVMAQRHIAPSQASLIMSLEAVFALLGGWWLLHERMGERELWGCALMFAGVVLSQIPEKRKTTATQP